MSDDVKEIIPRPRNLMDTIDLPDGEVLIKRKVFAEKKVGGCERTLARMNLPTVYLSGVAYLKQNASLKIIADKAVRRNQPTTPRYTRSHGLPPGKRRRA